MCRGRARGRLELRIGNTEAPSGTPAEWTARTSCSSRSCTRRSTPSCTQQYGFLAVLFFLLAAADFTGSAAVRMVAGVEGIVCGLSAFYGAIAIVLNGQFGRTVLPMGTGG